MDDPVRIAARRALAVPAVVVDGRLVYSGGIPDRTLITSWLS